jgi:sec-independent protein translocase protein TatA
MNVFGIGLPELAVIAAIGLLVFGPRRLPELGRTLGKTLKGFQTASSEFEKEFRAAVVSTEALSSAEKPAEQLTGHQEPVEAPDPDIAIEPRQT